jgi:hypothetical protein
MVVTSVPEIEDPGSSSIRASSVCYMLMCVFDPFLYPSEEKFVSEKLYLSQLTIGLFIQNYFSVVQKQQDNLKSF